MHFQSCFTLKQGEVLNKTSKKVIGKMLKTVPGIYKYWWWGDKRQNLYILHTIGSALLRQCLSERLLQEETNKALTFAERLFPLLLFEGFRDHGLDWSDHVVPYLFNIYVFKDVCTFIHLPHYNTNSFYKFQFDWCERI